MTLREQFDAEKRNENNKYNIHLYVSGKFCIAYEWSAVLLHNYPNNVEDENKLKYVLNSLKGTNGVIKVGFPFKSSKKFIPHYNIGNIDGDMKANDIIIDCTEIFKDTELGNVSLTDIENILENKRKECIANQRKNKDKNKNTLANYSNENFNIISIFKEVLNYDIDKASDSEIREVMKNIQRQSTKLLTRLF